MDAPLYSYSANQKRVQLCHIVWSATLVDSTCTNESNHVKINLTEHPVMVAAPTITIMGLKWTRRKGWERDFACFPHSDIACYGNIALMVFRSWKQKTRSILSSYSPPSMESGPSSVHWHPFLLLFSSSVLSLLWLEYRHERQWSERHWAQ